MWSAYKRGIELRSPVIEKVEFVLARPEYTLFCVAVGRIDFSVDQRLLGPVSLGEHAPIRIGDDAAAQVGRATFLTDAIGSYQI